MAKAKKSRISPTKLIVAALVIFAGAGAYAWWQYSYTNPTKVFNRMIANNLATPSVTKKSSQTAGDQSLDQTSIIVTQPKAYVASQSTLSQGSGSDKSEVVTETLAFPTEEYTRWLSITTAQKGSNGKPLDFSKILGVWGYTGPEDAQSGSQAQTFSQSILGVIPIGSMNASQRKALVTYINGNNVFGVNTANVKKEWKDNRLVYTYVGSVKPVPYVTMLKKFSGSLGLHDLDGVEPEQYKDSAPIPFTVTVDVISGQMTKVAYGANEQVDNYSAYGYRPVIKTPTDAVPISQLQMMLQQAAQ